MPVLKKEDILPGVKVVINDVIRDGLPGAFRGPDDSDVLEYLSITPSVGGYFSGAWHVESGAILEIVKKPRKVGRINSVRVRRQDDPSVEGEVYWCELRASATLLMEDNL